MIRFQPDTLRDALWRPLAMAAPDSNVYLEIMAPDLRFAMLLVLTVVGAGVALRRRQRPGPLAALLAFAWLAFIPWLATTGNGRYFIPVLLLTGPLCMALVHRLPVTRNARLTLCLLLVAVQAVAVVEGDPRRRWALLPWGQPYLDIALTPAERDAPAAWVLISGISYSLVAPQFHPGSRWVNLSFLSGDVEHSPDDRRAQQRLAQARVEGLPVKLLVPTNPRYAERSGVPNAAAREEIDRMLASHRLALAGACEVRASRGMVPPGPALELSAPAVRPEHTGFWVCPLAYPVAPPAKAAVTAQAREVDLVFERVEQQCPRLFPPGGSRTARMQDGYRRGYPTTDMNTYVMDDGEVRFKYWRALNPNRIGTREEVMAPGFRMDCHQVHGRSGLPWERKL